jgi:LysM repeat protein
MSRLIVWTWAVCACVWTLPASPTGWATAYGQEAPAPVGQEQNEFLEYHVRPGESLSDIARLFRMPVEELAQVNHITDPTRLRIGQLVKVPNVFARQVGQLQEERDRLLAEKEPLQRELEGRQKTLDALKAELLGVEAEKTTLARELSATLQWQRGAHFLALLLLGMLGWNLKLRGERAKRTRKFALLVQENAALGVAKEKYRQAAAQLEFRYQKLYNSRAEVPAKFIPEGTAILARSFAEGCAQLEQLLESIKAEREKGEQLLHAEQKTFDVLFHPLRGFLQRHRLKYHET